LVVIDVLYQALIVIVVVKLKVVLFGISVLSLTPSKTILPPFVELNVGPFINVPLLLFLDKSLHIVPVVGYERVFAASKYNTSPSVIIFGE
jgi:hypothetical protein